MSLLEKSNDYGNFRHRHELVRGAAIQWCMTYFPHYINTIKRDIKNIMAGLPNPLFFLEETEKELEDLQIEYQHEVSKKVYTVINNLLGWEQIVLNFDPPNDPPIFKILVQRPNVPEDVARANELITQAINEKDLKEEVDFDSIWLTLVDKLYLEAIEVLLDFVNTEILQLDDETTPVEKIITTMTAEQLAVFFRYFYEENVDLQKTGKNAFIRTIVRVFRKTDGSSFSPKAIANHMKHKALLSSTTRDRLKEVYKLNIKKLEDYPYFK